MRSAPGNFIATITRHSLDMIESQEITAICIRTSYRRRMLRQINQFTTAGTTPYKSIHAAGRTISQTATYGSFQRGHYKGGSLPCSNHVSTV